MYLPTFSARGTGFTYSSDAPAAVSVFAGVSLDFATCWSPSATEVTSPQASYFTFLLTRACQEKAFSVYRQNRFQKYKSRRINTLFFPQFLYVTYLNLGLNYISTG